MSRLVLVRHGETVWHAENRYAGISDIGLTAKGIAQAEQLAHWAACAQLSAVWSSPLSRAQATAAPAAQAAQLRLQIDPRLQELSFGQAEGLTAAEMHARFPAERVAFEQNPVRHFLPGGEDPSTAADRGCAALRAIAGAQGRRRGVSSSATARFFAWCFAGFLASALHSTGTFFPSFTTAVLWSSSSAPFTSACSL